MFTVRTHYAIVDNRDEGRVVGTAKTLKGARRSCDRRDREYGAYRYSHRPVYREATAEEFLAQRVEDENRIRDMSGQGPLSGAELDSFLRDQLHNARKVNSMARELPRGASVEEIA